MAGLLAGFLKHSGIYAVGNVLNRVGALVLLPLYTNYLTVEQYGQLELLYSVNTVLSTLVGAGLAHTTLRFFYDETDVSRRGRIITTTFLLSLIATLTFSAIGVMASDVLAHRLLGSGSPVAAVQLMFGIMLFELSSEICLAYVRARERSVFFVAVSLLRLIVQVTANVYLVGFANLGVTGVMTGNLVSVASGWLVLSVFTLRECGIRPDFGKVRAIYRYSLPLAISGLVGVVGANVDRFVLNALVSTEAVGIYGLGTKFALLLRFVFLEPFQRSYGAFRFSILDRTDAKDIQKNLTALFFVATVVAAAGVAAITPGALRLFSPDSYWPASTVASLAVIGIVAQGVSYCFETGLLVQKNTRSIFAVSVGATLLSALLLPLFAIPFGVIGVTMAAVVVQVVSGIAVHQLANRTYPLKYFERTQWRIAAIGLCVMLVMTLTAQLWLPIQLAVAAVAFGVLVLAVWREDAAVRDALRAGILRIRGRRDDGVVP